MNFRQSAEHILLGILMTGPKYGYELHSYISNHMSQFWALSMSQVYALLKRMARDNMVVSQEEWQKTRPPKKIFTVTPKGKEIFLEWLVTPAQHVRDMRIELMAKLFFMRTLCLKEGPAFLDRQIAVLEEKLQGIERSRDRSADEFQAMLYSFKASQAAAALGWLRQCKASLSRNQKRGMD
jgi:DNA-binding PadR family transcriptional regulator